MRFSFFSNHTTYSFFFRKQVWRENLCHHITLMESKSTKIWITPIGSMRTSTLDCGRSLNSAGKIRGLAFFFARKIVRFYFADRRRKLGRKIQVPPMLIYSITTECNLDCAGCYAKLLMAISTREIRGCHADEIGVSYILTAGGEPFMRPELLDVTAKHPSSSPHSPMGCWSRKNISASSGNRNMSSRSSALKAMSWTRITAAGWAFTKMDWT